VWEDGGDEQGREISSWPERVAPVDPSTYAWVTSEKQVTATTHASAIGRAFSWTQREKPRRRAAESGSALPAMNPATHALAWSARTRELRSRIRATSSAPAGKLIPAM
jgi:hypothetical protein